MNARRTAIARRTYRLPCLSEPTPLTSGPPRENGGPLVLIVEDHEVVQHVIRQHLDALACRSAIAGTGEAAIAQFERTRFDMVLLDCGLPDLDGYAVAGRMRDAERMRHATRTPIIAISAATDDAHRARCFDSGMDGVLGKPLRVAALRQMISLWCAHGEPASSTPGAGRTGPAQTGFHAVYAHSVGDDLDALAQALSDRDAERARHAAHRIKGAAAIAGHARTRDLAAAIERALLASSDGIDAYADELFTQLLRSHRDDLALPDGDSGRSPGSRA